MRISVTKLKRKYPHPVRGMVSRGCDYCVGGALCKETAIGDIDFPNQQQIRDAVLLANPKIGSWYELTDRQQEEIWVLVKGVIEANDAGNFDLSWKCLGRLLHWQS